MGLEPAASCVKSKRYNQLNYAPAIQTVIAAVFLPVVGAHGYSSMFFLFAACLVLYFLAAAFWLPETKAKTLEEIEAHFAAPGKTRVAVDS